MRVAVLGTGIMGAPMARNVAAAGHEVSAWNRSREKAEPLAQDGITVAASVAEAVAGADVVVTMLADAAAVEAVAEEALGRARLAQPHRLRADGVEDRVHALADVLRA